MALPFHIFLLILICLHLSNVVPSSPPGPQIQPDQDRSSVGTYAQTEPAKITRPEQTQDNLVQLSTTENLVQFSNGNLSLQIQTYREAPFVLKTADVNLPGYKSFTNIIDLGLLAVAAHNSRKFLTAHNEQAAYLEQGGFHSKFKSADNIDWEFLHFPGQLDFHDCSLFCPVYNASMPSGHDEVRTAGRVLGLDKDDFLWINTEQRSSRRKAWTWQNVYDYTLFMDNIQIYPQNIVDTDIVMNCTAYKYNKLIDQDDIGYIYKWYADNKYHQTQPFQLQTAVNPAFTCRVIVPVEDRSYNHHLDDAHCVCSRSKTLYFYDKNKLEAQDLHMELDEAWQMHIEDWRFKTNGVSVSVLEEIQESQKVEPRYVQYSQSKIVTPRDSYLTPENLTTLELDTDRSLTLKTKDVLSSIFTGLTKVAISNPKLLSNLHRMVKDSMSMDTQVHMVPSKSIMGSDDAFAESVNEVYKDYNIRRNQSIISVSSQQNSQINWDSLSLSRTGLDAETGINAARRQIMGIDHFHKEVLHTILDKILIPRALLEDVHVVLDEDSIVKYQHYDSYIAIKIFVPIRLKETTTLYSIAALPFKYDQTTDLFVEKALPPLISVQLGQSQDLHHGPETPCGLEIIRAGRSTNKCRNRTIKYAYINNIMSIDEYNIFLIRKIGTISVSCPQRRLAWYDLQHQVNILVVHGSCYLESRASDFNLAINPNTTAPAAGVSLVFLMSYDIKVDWVPTKDARWSVTITLVTVVGLVLILLIAAIIYLVKKKPWYCRILNTTREAVEVVDPYLQYFKDLKEEKMSKTEQKVEDDKHKLNKRQQKSLQMEDAQNYSHKYRYGEDDIETNVPITHIFKEEDKFRTIRKGDMVHEDWDPPEFDDLHLDAFGPPGRAPGSAVYKQH